MANFSVITLWISKELVNNVIYCPLYEITNQLGFSKVIFREKKRRKKRKNVTWCTRCQDIDIRKLRQICVFFINEILRSCQIDDTVNSKKLHQICNFFGNLIFFMIVSRHYALAYISYFCTCRIQILVLP